MQKTEEVVVIGVNHVNTDVSVRETISPQSIQSFVTKRTVKAHIREWMLLHTCNRIELYLVTDASVTVKQHLGQLFPVKFAYTYENREAIKHLFSVSSGLDSLLIGETEILSQLRFAYKNAIETESVGPLLHQLFQDALRVGKETRNKTQIGKGVTSVTQAALLMAQKHIGTLAGKTVLVIGAGFVGRRLVAAVRKTGVSDCVIVSRTFRTAVKVSEEFGGTAGQMDKLIEYLAKADVIFSATNSNGFILTKANITKAMRKRPNLKLCLIDLASPRDIDPDAANVKSVMLSNIDEVQRIVDANVAQRKQSALKAERIIAAETKAFLQWLSIRQTAPLVATLARHASSIRDRELERALNKLTHLNERDKYIIASLAKRLESKLLAKPIARIKELSDTAGAVQQMDVVKSLFE